MRRALLHVAAVLWGTCVITTAADPKPVRRVVVVRGAAGTPEYGKLFDEWAERWEKAAKVGGCDVVRIGPSEKNSTPSDASDRDLLLKSLATSTNESVVELWVALLGHGTFDGKTPKFNLRGDDVSSLDLKDALSRRTELTAVVNCAAASSPFLTDLAGKNRVVITATKSASEQNFARFGEYFSKAIGDPINDLDKDGQTSLLEAFLMASRQTKQFYDSDGRLETEHSLLDDNGDGQGIRADWFRGLRLIKKPDNGQSVDGQLALQFRLTLSAQDQKLAPAARRQRDELVRAVMQLRQQRATFKTEDAYFAELEKLCLRIAELDQQP